MGGGMPPNPPEAWDEGSTVTPKAKSSLPCETSLEGPRPSLSPVSAEVLRSAGLMGEEYSVLEVSDETIRSLLSDYLVGLRREDSSLVNAESFSVRSTVGHEHSTDPFEMQNECCGDPDCDAEHGYNYSALSLGKGVHAFQHQGETVWLVKQNLGDPVGTVNEVDMYSSTLLLARGRGRESMLQRLCDSLLESNEQDVENTYHLFQWSVEREYWRHQGMRTARPVDSVVLPPEQRKLAVGDMEEFLHKSTRKFYMEHGIPYKRAYLYWGVPGTGKTSLIQALAGQCKRRLCFMQPTDPKFTDDMLKHAISAAPKQALIVFEDIDALFTKDRENRGKSAVTFSGLLNALDGVGMPQGQIFILTTNFREQLDSALIRNGRVDVHVEFKHIAEEQCREMFLRFYKQADASLAKEFVERMKAECGERCKRMTPSVLQHFFIQHRKLTAREIIHKVLDIKEEHVKRNGTDQEDDEGTAGEAEDKSEGKEKSEIEDKDESRERDQEDVLPLSSAPPGPTHHYWHFSVSPSLALTVVAGLCLPILCKRIAR